MGIEQNYEAILRDERWSKAVRIVRDNGLLCDPETDLGREIEKSLVGDFNDGKMLTIADTFCEVVKLLATTNGSLFVTNNDKQLLLRGLSHISANQQKETSCVLGGRFLDEVYKHIQASTRNPCHSDCLPRDSVCQLIKSALRYYVKAKMQAAIRLNSQQSKQDVKEVIARVDKAIDNAHLDRIVQQLISGKSFMRSSPRPSRPVEEMLKESLIGKDPKRRKSE